MTPARYEIKQFGRWIQADFITYQGANPRERRVTAHGLSMWQEELRVLRMKAPHVDPAPQT